MPAYQNHKIRVVGLPPVLAAPASWYAAMLQGDIVFIDRDTPYNKRDKSTHRFDIADVRGRLSVTVPVCHPADGDHRRLTWNDILISDHNRWWHTAANTLATAYGGTPWFGDLWPRFEDLFTSGVAGRPVLNYLMDFDAIIRDILDIPARMTAAIPPGTGIIRADDCTVAPYRQVRADKLGFIGGLSVLDAIFNLGAADTRDLLNRAAGV